MTNESLKKAYLSHSKLMKFVQDPWKFVVRYVLNIKEPEKKVYEDGKLLHRIINIVLFSKTMEELQKIIISKDINLRTKAGKEEKEALEKDGKILVKEEQMSMIKCWYAWARTDQVLKDFPDKQDQAWIERELKNDDKCVMGIPDLVLSKDGVVVDIKTTGINATYDQFARFIEIQLLYQANIYLDLVAHNTKKKREDLQFYFLVASKTYPYHFSLLPSVEPNAVKEFNIDLANTYPSLEKDIENYFDFYGRLVAVLGFDPILEKKEFSVEGFIDTFKKLKKDKFFRQVLNYDKGILFNDYALQRIFDRA